MESIKINNGSIDLIYSTDEKYVFLEVNPVGQFGVVTITIYIKNLPNI